MISQDTCATALTLTTTRSRIGIFGAVMDPPHLGHAGVIRAALNSGLVDEVWVVPPLVRTGKNSLSDSYHRLEMASLFIRDLFAFSAPPQAHAHHASSRNTGASDGSESIEPVVKLCTFQIDGTLSSSTTIELMRFLASRYKECTFSFVMGSDNLTDIDSWVESDSLKKEVPFIVIPRPGSNGLSDRTLLDSFTSLTVLDNLQGLLADISSTAVRPLLVSGGVTAGLITPGVHSYISLHQLYGAPPLPTTQEYLGAGRFLELVRVNSWEFARRRNASNVVVIAATTAAGEILLVEQYRAAVNAKAIELPAGLVGDATLSAGESLLSAAIRELTEETGHSPGTIYQTFSGPSSAGLTDEMLHFFIAEDCTQVSLECGADDEQILCHIIPLAQVSAWIKEKALEGFIIDPKILVGLTLLKDTLLKNREWQTGKG